MRIVRTAADVRRLLRASRAIGFVPTMGALHEGHAALFRAARAASDIVVASVFVNPTQFNDASDLAAYPRTEERDAEMAAAAGVDIVFAPETSTIYPAGFATAVDVQGDGLGYESDYRPGHFRGVATVCLKLFHIVSPTTVHFGQKDAQQVAVIAQMIRDLDMPLALAVVPTVRDADGVALSSRNARLSPEDRRRAGAIPRALQAALDAYRRMGAALPDDAGEVGARVDRADVDRAHTDRTEVVRAARAVLEADGMAIDYVDVAPFGTGPTLVIAVRLGTTRLIDNVPLDDAARAGF